jgi:protein phosphatase
LLAEAAAEEAAAAAAMGVRRVGAVEDLRCLDEEIDRDASAAASRYAVDSRACTEQSGNAVNHPDTCHVIGRVAE